MTNEITISDVERALRTIARVAIENEAYWSDLDGELGDADFGKSIATGFRAILSEFDKIERPDIGTFLTKVGMIFLANVGGTSGPVWSTAFMRAGITVRGKNTLTLSDIAMMGHNAVQGIMARGGAREGDKTLLDALIPAVAKLDDFAKNNPAELLGAFRAASAAASLAVEVTRQWPAKKGRQSYSSERTVGTLDPGIVAVATMTRAVVAEMYSTKSQC
jgi:phosphoenolpyruvate---glycerone phosphotransferase subunit DhaL